MGDQGLIAAVQLDLADKGGAEQPDPLVLSSDEVEGMTWRHFEVLLKSMYAQTPDSIHVKYLDDENDWIEMSSDAELKEALKFTSESGEILQLLVKASEPVNLMTIDDKTDETTQADGQPKESDSTPAPSFYPPQVPVWQPIYIPTTDPGGDVTCLTYPHPHPLIPATTQQAVPHPNPFNPTPAEQAAPPQPSTPVPLPFVPATNPLQFQMFGTGANPNPPPLPPLPSVPPVPPLPPHPTPLSNNGSGTDDQMPKLVYPYPPSGPALTPEPPRPANVPADWSQASSLGMQAKVQFLKDMVAQRQGGSNQNQDPFEMVPCLSTSNNNNNNHPPGQAASSSILTPIPAGTKPAAVKPPQFVATPPVPPPRENVVPDSAAASEKPPPPSNGCRPKVSYRSAVVPKAKLVKKSTVDANVHPVLMEGAQAGANAVAIDMPFESDCVDRTTIVGAGEPEIAAASGSTPGPCETVTRSGAQASCVAKENLPRGNSEETAVKAKLQKEEKKSEAKSTKSHKGDGGEKEAKEADDNEEKANGSLCYKDFVKHMKKFKKELHSSIVKDVNKNTDHLLKKRLSASAKQENSQPVVDVSNSPVVHLGITCDSCDMQIVGIRFKCGNCPDFDLCEGCESNVIEHDPTHVFLKLRRPAQKAGCVGSFRLPLLRENVYDAETHWEDPRSLEKSKEEMKEREDEEEKRMKKKKESDKAKAKKEGKKKKSSKEKEGKKKDDKKEEKRRKKIQEEVKKEEDFKEMFEIRVVDPLKEDQPKVILCSEDSMDKKETSEECLVNASEEECSTPPMADQSCDLTPLTAALPVQPRDVAEAPTPVPRRSRAVSNSSSGSSSICQLAAEPSQDAPKPSAVNSFEDGSVEMVALVPSCSLDECAIVPPLVAERLPQADDVSSASSYACYESDSSEDFCVIDHPGTENYQDYEEIGQEDAISDLEFDETEEQIELQSDTVVVQVDLGFGEEYQIPIHQTEEMFRERLQRASSTEATGEVVRDTEVFVEASSDKESFVEASSDKEACTEARGDKKPSIEARGDKEASTEACGYKEASIEAPCDKEAISDKEEIFEEVYSRKSSIEALEAPVEQRVEPTTEAPREADVETREIGDLVHVLSEEEKFHFQELLKAEMERDALETKEQNCGKSEQQLEKKQSLEEEMKKLEQQAMERNLPKESNTKTKLVKDKVSIKAESEDASAVADAVVADGASGADASKEDEYREILEVKTMQAVLANSGLEDAVLETEARRLLDEEGDQMKAHRERDPAYYRLQVTNKRVGQMLELEVQKFAALDGGDKEKLAEVERELKKLDWQQRLDEKKIELVQRDVQAKMARREEQGEGCLSRQTSSTSTQCDDGSGESSSTSTTTTEGSFYVDKRDADCQTFSSEDSKASSQLIHNVASGVTKAASSAFSTAKDVFFSLQAKQNEWKMSKTTPKWTPGTNTFVPVTSTWIPPKDTFVVPKSDYIPPKDDFVPPTNNYVPPSTLIPQETTASDNQTDQSEACANPAGQNTDSGSTVEVKTSLEKADSALRREINGMQKLIEMGFANRDKNKALLSRYGGDVEKVVQALLEEQGDEHWSALRH